MIASVSPQLLAKQHQRQYYVIYFVGSTYQQSVWRLATIYESVMIYDSMVIRLTLCFCFLLVIVF